jgi:hypothetical chaperone protein
LARGRGFSVLPPAARAEAAPALLARRHRVPVTLERSVARADFESWIGAELEAMGASVDLLIAATGVRAEQIDRVFLTGGSALVPAVRRLFEARFGADRIAGGGEFTSVATGLALRAERDFGQD